MSHSRTSQHNLPPFAFSLRQWFGMALLFIALTSLGIVSVYWQVEGVRWQWDAALLNPFFLISAAALVGVYFLADGLRLWFTLKALGYPIPAKAMFRLVFLNIFVSNITPLATGGGVAQVWFLRRYQVPIGTAMTATTIRTVLAMLMIFSAAPILWSLIPDLGGQSRRLIQTGLWLSASVYAFGVALLLFKTDWFIKILITLLAGLWTLKMLSKKRFNHLKRHWVRELRRFSRGFKDYFRGGLLWVSASVVSTAVFLLTLFSVPALIFAALGYELSYWLSVAKMLVTTFIMYFSPTPGGSGIAEGVFGRFFASDVLATHLVLTIIAWRALTIYLGLFIGLLVSLRLMRPKPTKQATKI